MQELKFTSTTNSQNRACRVYRIITGTTQEITDREYDFSQEEFIYEDENIIGEYEIRCEVNGELCVYLREITNSMLITTPTGSTPTVYTFNVTEGSDPCNGGNEFNLYGINSDLTNNTILYTDINLTNIWQQTTPTFLSIGNILYEYDGENFISSTTCPSSAPAVFDINLIGNTNSNFDINIRKHNVCLRPISDEFTAYTQVNTIDDGSVIYSDSNLTQPLIDGVYVLDEQIIIIQNGEVRLLESCNTLPTLYNFTVSSGTTNNDACSEIINADINISSFNSSPFVGDTIYLTDSLSSNTIQILPEGFYAYDNVWFEVGSSNVIVNTGVCSVPPTNSTSLLPLLVSSNLDGNLTPKERQLDVCIKPKINVVYADTQEHNQLTWIYSDDQGNTPLTNGVYGYTTSSFTGWFVVDGGYVTSYGECSNIIIYNNTAVIGTTTDALNTNGVCNPNKTPTQPIFTLNNPPNIGDRVYTSNPLTSINLAPDGFYLYQGQWFEISGNNGIVNNTGFCASTSAIADPDNINFNSDGTITINGVRENSIDIAVTSNAYWRLETVSNFFNFNIQSSTNNESFGSGVITITCNPNNTGISYNGTLNIVDRFNNNPTLEVINISQDAFVSTLNVIEDEIIFPGSGGSIDVNIVSNESWQVTGSTPSWITSIVPNFANGDSVITITADVGLDNARPADIIQFIGSNGKIDSLSVRQEPNEFIRIEDGQNGFIEIVDGDTLQLNSSTPYQLNLESNISWSFNIGGGPTSEWLKISDTQNSTGSQLSFSGSNNQILYLMNRSDYSGSTPNKTVTISGNGITINFTVSLI